MKLFGKSKSAAPASDNLYPGFRYQAHQIVRFLQSGYSFIIVLADGGIIHHEPANVKAFSDWLSSHKVPNALISRT